MTADPGGAPAQVSPPPGMHQREALPENVLEHLKLLQAIIARLSLSSTGTKGWAITVVSGICAVVARDPRPYPLIAAFWAASLLVVWLFRQLDAWYLLRERQFRALYDAWAGLRDTTRALVPYSMAVDVFPADPKLTLESALDSDAVRPLYRGLAAVVTVVAFGLVVVTATTPPTAPPSPGTVQVTTPLRHPVALVPSDRPVAHEAPSAPVDR